MIKFLPLLFLTFILSCSSNKEQANNELASIYTPVVEASITVPRESVIETTEDLSSYYSKTPITDTIHIGPTREMKSLQEYFQMHRKDGVRNVYILVDEGNYNTDEELWVKGENIVVEGRGKVNLFCTKLYENVMWVEGNYIVVKNFRMKHLIPSDGKYQNCSGRVLAFDNAHNIVIENCDLNGCGLAGLHDNMGNSKILIKNNYIHNNSLGAYTDIDGGVWFEEIKNHPVFKFKNNRMENNGPGRDVESDGADQN